MRAPAHLSSAETWTILGREESFAMLEEEVMKFLALVMCTKSLETRLSILLDEEEYMKKGRIIGNRRWDEDYKNITLAVESTIRRSN